MANPFQRSRNFLHPTTPQGKLRVEDYQTTAEGITRNGTRIRQVQASNPAVSSAYRHGIQVEMPNAPSMMIFGSYQEINDIGQQIKADIDSVVKTLRPTGPGRIFGLNKPITDRTHTQPDPGSADRYVRAKTIFKDHGRENQPLDRAQEEKAALRQHQRELAESKHLFPSSSTAQEAIAAEMNPVSKPGTTLVTEAADES